MDDKVKRTVFVLIIVFILICLQLVQTKKNGKFRRRRIKNKIADQRSIQTFQPHRNGQTEASSFIKCAGSLQRRCHKLRSKCHLGILTKRSLPEKKKFKKRKRKRFKKARRSRIRAKHSKRKKRKRIRVKVTCDNCRKWCWKK